MLGTKNRKT